MCASGPTVSQKRIGESSIVAYTQWNTLGHLKLHTSPTAREACTMKRCQKPCWNYIASLALPQTPSGFQQHFTWVFAFVHFHSFDVGLFIAKFNAIQQKSHECLNGSPTLAPLSHSHSSPPALPTGAAWTCPSPYWEATLLANLPTVAVGQNKCDWRRRWTGAGGGEPNVNITLTAHCHKFKWKFPGHCSPLCMCQSQPQCLRLCLRRVSACLCGEFISVACLPSFTVSSPC